MKIAHTKSSVRISLTENEFELIGRPTRVWVNLKDKTVTAVSAADYPANSVSMYEHTDSTHPYTSTIPKEFAIVLGWPEFGTETVDTSPNGLNSLRFKVPPMKRPVIERTFDPKDIVDRRAAALASTKPTTAPDAMRICSLVDEINAAKTALGKNFIISVDADGYLEVLTRAGR